MFSRGPIIETARSKNINNKRWYEKYTKPIIYLNNSLGHFIIKTKNHIKDVNFLFEDIKITTNRIFLSDTPGGGTDFRDWTNMEKIQVSEFCKEKIEDH